MTAEARTFALAQSQAITPIEYIGLQAAYDHFNVELFGGKLPDVFITYERHPHMRGCFYPNRYTGRDTGGRVHGLALNPDSFIERTDEQILSTLVHEQHHVRQECFGTPPKRHYHNKQWAAAMKSTGLQPSNTGVIGAPPSAL